MSYSDYLEKLLYLVDLLNHGNTGSADILAKKLNVSRRTIFRYLDELRMKGAVIGFSKIKKTYYLKNKSNFKGIYARSLSD
jgi:predicted DNA-binding transcriptional regulator YafY